MKKIMLLIPFFLFGCSARKAFVTDPAVVRAHPAPVRIYEIGIWRPGYLVLNLVDAKGVHFNIVAPDGRRLKEGVVYQP